jgi:hypothetical protein
MDALARRGKEFEQWLKNGDVMDTHRQIVFVVFHMFL